MIPCSSWFIMVLANLSQIAIKFSVTISFGVLQFLYEAIWYPQLLRPCMISKMVDSTNFNFGRLLGLSMTGKNLVELMI